MDQRKITDVLGRHSDGARPTGMNGIPDRIRTFALLKKFQSAHETEIAQSGIFGSSPQTADPTLLAAADPTRFAAENGELMVALSVER
ncbi:hypothetical protein [Bradyrhizobium sp.]